MRSACLGTVPLTDAELASYLEYDKKQLLVYCRYIDLDLAQIIIKLV